MSSLAVIEKNDGSEEQRSWADENWRLFFAMTNPLTAPEAMVEYWGNVFAFFSSDPKTTPPEIKLWSSSDKMQITYVAAKRRMATLFLASDRGEFNIVDRLHEEYQKLGAGLHLLPPGLEALKKAGDDIRRYGEMVYSNNPAKEPEIAFGPYINLSDLAREGAFRGRAGERKDCRSLNLEHCMFNDDLNTTVSMQYADMKYSNLRHANLRGCNLEHTDFCGADLRGADLRDAKLDGILYDSYTTVDQNTKLPNHFTAHFIAEEKQGEKLGIRGNPGRGFDTHDPAFLRKNPRFGEKSAVITTKDGLPTGTVVPFRAGNIIPK